MTTPNSHAAKTINETLAEIASIRDQARIQMHLFSLDAKQRWSELEAKLQAVSADGVADTALARLRELTRLARSFVEEHRNPVAGTAAAIMTQDVRTCSAEESLNHPARIMWEMDCGAVPVVDSEGKLVGMITDRDVCMAAYTRGQPIWASTVASVMSAPAQSCAPEDSVERVAEIMRERRIRRVPVTQSDGRLVGIVSLADIARYVRSSAVSTSHPDWFAATVAAVSAPHAPAQAATAAQ